VLSPELKGVIERAVEEARHRHHRVVTLEHAVYAMADAPAGAELLSACGARPRELRADLARKLDELPAPGGDDLELAAELHAALQRMAVHASGAGHDQVTLGGFLAALLLERTAYAVSALTLQHVTRLSVTLHLTHGASRRTAMPAARMLGRWRFLSWLRRTLASVGAAIVRWAPRGASTRYEVLVHNDEYTTRDFVVGLMIALFSRSPADAEAFVQEIHVHGVGCAGRYPLREARRLVERATADARREEFPLRLSIVRAP
jgi:ATP-dependent Clp protease adapter protein ClpS